MTLFLLLFLCLPHHSLKYDTIIKFLKYLIIFMKRIGFMTDLKMDTFRNKKKFLSPDIYLLLRKFRIYKHEKQTYLCNSIVLTPCICFQLIYYLLK